MTGADAAAVLVSVARTPIGKLGGALRDVDALDLGATAVASAVQRAGGLVPDYVALGNVVQAGNGQNPARVAAVRGGVPTTRPAITLNDVCLASMSAVGWAVALIERGEISSALVGGFESMSRAPHAARVRGTDKVGDACLVDLLVHDGLWCGLAEAGMGELSDAENDRWGIGRREQDELAALSHQRAVKASAAGIFDDEIAPVGDARDEGIRPDTTAEALARLAPAFTPSGTITAGNASQMSDAASAGLVTTRGRARAEGLEPIAEIVDRVVVAGPDYALHSKPAAAAGALIARNGLAASDIDRWEINEAFAGVVLAATRELGIGVDAVNVHGGAIALGHPLAASGFRLVLTLALELRRSGSEWGVAVLCGGGGQGQAVLLRNR